jgi:GTP-binding protein
MKFVDEVRIRVEAGDGGDGCSSFRHEKYVPRGGPDGGAGGAGGSVLLKGSRALQTLADFEYHSRHAAERGTHGKGKDMTGRQGADMVIPVPLGTDVYDCGLRTVNCELEAADCELKLGEVTREGELLLVAHGGRGGRGNASFKTHQNVAPRIREEGKPGERRRLRLALRMMSDIGLVGFPNAGKSTVLSRVTRAQPKIADYPFTTLTPNLGVLTGSETRYTVADLPGIIEGAAEGKGLGLRFLRHIERTGTLVFVIDASQPRPLAQYRALAAEIGQYNPEVLKKRQILVYNKMDIAPGKLARPRVKVEFVAISALTGDGISKLVALLNEQIAASR